MNSKLPFDVSIEWLSDTPIEQQCERVALNMARWLGQQGYDPQTMIELYQVIHREELSEADAEAYDSELALYEKRLKAERNEPINH
jgi:hypothetical protein